MSIESASPNPSEPLVHETINAINSRSRDHEDLAADAHPAIVLEESFWDELKVDLIAPVRANRQQLAINGEVRLAHHLRSLENLAIPVSVKEFKADSIDNPQIIHESAAWEAFRQNIVTLADTHGF